MTLPSSEEIEFSKLGREYREKFGKGYPLGPNQPTVRFTESELIADIRRCIEEGVPREPAPIRLDVVY